MSQSGLFDFMAQQGIGRVVIFSPHLDDAAFSTCGLLLSGIAPACHVVTIFTESSPDVDQSWALAGGFADAMHEHVARRREDRDAMRRLGVRFTHLGFKPGAFTVAAAHDVLDRMLSAADRSARGSRDREVLCLLPAGAGFAGRLRHFLWRCNRLLGRPGGAPAHPEHMLVRDRLLRALDERCFRVGFYSEFPYLWLDSARILKWRLERSCGGRVDRFEVNVDPWRKLGVVEMYASQAPLVLGMTAEERLRTLGRAEEYFIAMPKSAGSGSRRPEARGDEI
jgi:hypothetical protein